MFSTVFGNNLNMRDNQQERLIKTTKFDDDFKWFLAGFVDGEGSFCVSIKKHPSTKFGWQIDPAFYLYQHEENRWYLELVKKFFHGGSIHCKSSPYNVFTYCLKGVRNMDEKILPFFQKYKLMTKRQSFDLFAKVVKLMMKKEHLKKQGFRKILKIAYKINQIGKGRKWALDRVLKESSETKR